MIMLGEYIWIEKLFNRIPLPYPVVSLIASVIICLIFEFFSTKNIINFNLNDIYYAIPVTAASILIAYQLAGIQYLLKDLRKIFKNLFVQQDNNIGLDYLNKKFKYANLNYISVVSIMFVFLIIDIMRMNCYQLGTICDYTRSDICGNYMLFTRPCDFSNPQKLLHSWNFGLDVYRFLVSYLAYYLFGIILWIILSVYQILGDLGENLHKNQINVDIFHVDKAGGLKPLIDFVAKASIYYFFCVAIVITSSISPITPMPLETIFLLVLLFIGIGFFFMGKITIHGIFTQKIQSELDNINQECKIQEQELRHLLSQKRNGKAYEELTFISDSIELLNKERDRLLQIKTNAVDIATLIPFISSVLTAMVAILGRYQELQSQLKGLLPPNFFG
jgi:hypothetical protein